MKKYGLISAIALIALTNVVVLAGVAYNRSGEPDATVTLTERELNWKDSRSWTDREDSGLYLFLKWNQTAYNNHDGTLRDDYWFNQQKLAEVGFDTSYPLNDNKAYRYYNRQLPRQGYVVLEFDGDAYQNWQKKVRQEIKEKQRDLSEEKNPDKKKHLKNSIRYSEQSMVTQSHLFAVDVGRDPHKLRKQYSDQSKYIITPAVFRISRQSAYSKKGQIKPHNRYYLRGGIRKILVSEIHVTNDYRSFFTSGIKTHTNTYLPDNKPLSNLEPRYQVTLNYGKRYEPWIANVKKLK